MVLKLTTKTRVSASPVIPHEKIYKRYSDEIVWKCAKCGKVMMSDLRLKVNGGGYGIVVHVDEKQKAKIIDDVKVAVCPECGNIEMYLEDLTNLKD
ncbi:MAG: hypothetical protein WAZ76_03555 [Blautia wexlerae]